MNESRGRGHDVSVGRQLIGYLVWAAATAPGREELGGLCSGARNGENPAPTVAARNKDRWWHTRSALAWRGLAKAGERRCQQSGLQSGARAMDGMIYTVGRSAVLSCRCPRRGARCRMPRVEPDMGIALFFRVATSCCCLSVGQVCPGDRRNRTLIDRTGSFVDRWVKLFPGAGQEGPVPLLLDRGTLAIPPHQGAKMEKWKAGMLNVTDECGWIG